jgi:hypothetical protein
LATALPGTVEPEEASAGQVPGTSLLVLVGTGSVAAVVLMSAQVGL